jgi:capsular exopolysaccharide synthesis family protein
VKAVDLRRLIAVIRAWLPLIAAATVLAGAAAFVVSNLQQRVFEAKATLIVGQSLSAANPDYNQLLVAEGLSNTYASIAETRPILEKVIKTLALEETPDELSRRVEANVPGASTLLTITARDTDPALAASIANELADQLIAASPAIRGREAALQESIDRDLAATQDQIEATQEQLQTLTAIDDRTPAQAAELQVLEGRLVSLRATFASLLPLSSGSASNVLTVVEPADTPTQPVAPTTLLNTLLAAVLGLVVVSGIAFLAEQLDDTIRDAEAVRELTGLSNLGTINLMRGDRGRSEIYRMVTLLYPRSIAAEAYRALRVNVEFASVDKPVQTLLVTSAAPGEGKTLTSTNLAVVFAQAGRRVVLVDADLRWPSVHKYFDLPNDHGLTSLLRGDAVELDRVSQATEQPNLRVLTTGPLPPNPAEQLGSHRMQGVLEMLRKNADVVIFDSPPILAVADGAVLSAFADGTLLVIDSSHSHRRQVANASVALARAGANTLGAVLNRVAVVDSFHYAGHYGESGAIDGRLAHPDSSDSGTSPTLTAGR